MCARARVRFIREVSFWLVVLLVQFYTHLHSHQTEREREREKEREKTFLRFLGLQRRSRGFALRANERLKNNIVLQNI